MLLMTRQRCFFGTAAQGGSLSANLIAAEQGLFARKGGCAEGGASKAWLAGLRHQANRGCLLAACSTMNVPREVSCCCWLLPASPLPRANTLLPLSGTCASSKGSVKWLASPVA